MKLKFVVNYLPLGLFDRLRVRCHCFASDYANWYNGMMLFIKDIRILVSVCDSKQPSIFITGRNEKDKLNELWESILRIVRVSCFASYIFQFSLISLFWGEGEG